MIERTLSAIGAGALAFLGLSSGAFAQKLLIDDSLLGTTIGKHNGGRLTAEGYMPGQDRNTRAFPCPEDPKEMCQDHNHILYRLPKTVADGVIEFEVKGMTNTPWPEDAEHCFLGMYNGRGIEEPIRYFNSYKYNFNRYQPRGPRRQAALGHERRAEHTRPERAAEGRLQPALAQGARALDGRHRGLVRDVEDRELAQGQDRVAPDQVQGLGRRCPQDGLRGRLSVCAQRAPPVVRQRGRPSQQGRLEIRRPDRQRHLPEPQGLHVRREHTGLCLGCRGWLDLGRRRCRHRRRRLSRRGGGGRPGPEGRRRDHDDRRDTGRCHRRRQRGLGDGRGCARRNPRRLDAAPWRADMHRKVARPRRWSCSFLCSRSARDRRREDADLASRPAAAR